jgi:hypothetical protein
MHWQVVKDFLGPGDWSRKIDGREGMNRNIFMEFPASTEGRITIPRPGGLRIGTI